MSGKTQGDLMARKAKKKMHRMPPLSAVDQLIYLSILLVLGAVYVVLFLVPFFLWRYNAFADEAVLAARAKMGLLWCLVPWFVFFITTFVLWVVPYQDRKPIFGKLNFRYGPPAWPKVYPVFMKNKPYVWVSKKTVADRRRKAVCLLILLAVSFIPYPWSWYSRYSVKQDGSVAQYNIFNIPVKEFSSGEIREVEFEAYWHYKSRNSLERIGDMKMHLITDSGKRYTFVYDDFRGNVLSGEYDWLPAMLELKSRYRPEIITYTGREYLPKVIHDNGLDGERKAMLRQLFEP